MFERRRSKRVSVDYWVSFLHSSFGQVAAEIQNISSGGLSVTLDDFMPFAPMMELEARIHGEGWEENMTPLPVQVVRVMDRELALRFLDTSEHFWSGFLDDQVEEEFSFDFDAEIRRLDSTVGIELLLNALQRRV